MGFGICTTDVRTAVSLWLNVVKSADVTQRGQHGLMRQTWCRAEVHTLHKGSIPFLLNLSLTELRLHTFVENDSVRKLASQPVTQSVPCGLIISVQKPLLCRRGIATRSKSLPRTSVIEMGDPCHPRLCVCLFRHHTLYFICSLSLFVPTASLQSHSPLISRRCSLG